MSTTVEMAVELTCQKCVDKAEKALSDVVGISKFQVDLQKQSVVVTSTLPSSQLLNLIENKVGKRAVLMGVSGSSSSSSSAVAMLGGLIGSGSVQVSEYILLLY